jgi:hypothetical protein
MVHFVREIFIPDSHGVNKIKYSSICIGHPDLMFRLRMGPVHAFIDGTFDCIPHPYKQVLVLMGYDEATATNYPICLVLLDCKLEVTTPLPTSYDSPSLISFLLLLGYV